MPLISGSRLAYRARDTKLNRDVELKALPDLFKSEGNVRSTYLADLAGSRMVEMVIVSP